MLLTPYRRTVQTLLHGIPALRKPFLRRSLRPDALLTTDLPRLTAPESLAWLIAALEAQGWTALRQGDYPGADARAGSSRARRAGFRRGRPSRAAAVVPPAEPSSSPPWRYRRHSCPSQGGRGGNPIPGKAVPNPVPAMRRLPAYPRASARRIAALRSPYTI